MEGRKVEKAGRTEEKKKGRKEGRKERRKDLARVELLEWKEGKKNEGRKDGRKDGWKVEKAGMQDQQWWRHRESAS